MDPNNTKEVGQNDTVENVETHYDEKRAVDLSHKDKAAAFLQNQERLEVTPEENKRIVKRIDLRLLPILLAVYFLQQLDKSVLSYSSVFGLIEDAKLVGQEYSWLGSVIYIAQLVMQPVIAVLLVKFPIGKFLAVMVLCWGSVLCCMAAAKDFKGLLITRLFLGLFEASVGKSRVTPSTSSQENRISLTHYFQLQLSLPSPRCGGEEVNKQTEMPVGTP